VRLRIIIPSPRLLASAWLAIAVPGRAQGPTPENGATLFPGGALVAWGSSIVTRSPGVAQAAATGDAGVRPTFGYEGVLTFAWAFRRDYEVIAELPVESLRFEPGAGPTGGGSGLGDLRMLLKHRFLRRDSERGTSQVSFVAGPKLPTGRTGSRDPSGALLPIGLQAGSGSTDLLLGLRGTYTGLFHVRRLVADATLDHLLRTQGADSSRMGNETEARLWISYRPHQSASVGKEWFIGPSLTYQQIGHDRRAGRDVTASGSRTLWLGATTYASPRAGLVFWLAAERAAAQQARSGLEAGLRVRFGVTRQFPLHD
jgi:hypothetical protein